MKKDLFRKEALDRLAAPENTDQIIIQPRLSLWIILLGLFILLVIAFIWATQITIYEEIGGDGIFINNSSTLQATIYVPFEDGKKVFPGMEVQISPLTLEKDEFGFIEGKVSGVTDWPLSTDEIAGYMKNNSELAGHFSRIVGYSPYGVNITLLHDPNNDADYRWSNQVEKPVMISAGVPCHGIIQVRSKKMLSSIFPWLESLQPWRA